MHYKNLRSEWVTEGWWELTPGEDAYVADTKNAFYYVYAESVDPQESRLHWSGGDYYATIGQGSEQYGFIEKKITTTEWGTWTHSFTCDQSSVTVPLPSAPTNSVLQGTVMETEALNVRLAGTSYSIIGQLENGARIR